MLLISQVPPSSMKPNQLHVSIVAEAPHLYSSLLRRCRDIKSSQLIKSVQAHIVVSGFPLLNIGAKLIDAYLKCGGVSYAHKVFDGMPHRHIVTWNSIIASYVGNKRSKEAIGIFERMVFEGVFPDEFTFSSIFKAFSEPGLELAGRRAHGLLMVLGVDSCNAFVGSSLVDMYSKMGRMREARLVLDRVVERDVVLYTALIVGYSQRGENANAIELFRSMINEGVKANDHTFASVLIACGNLGDLGTGGLIHNLVVKMGFEMAVASQTSLLTMYSKCGMIDESLKIFKQLSNPNQVTWTSLIAGLVQNDREEVALSIFRKMIRESVPLNSFTLSSSLRACSSLAMLGTGKQIHAIVMKFGLDTGRYVGSGLIDMYGKCGSIAMAKLIFESLITVDLVSINSLIYGYAQNGLGVEALELFNRMKEMNLEPNELTYLSILLACSNAGLVEDGLQIFVSMNNCSNIEIAKDHYACMVDLLGRSGRLEEAEKLVQQVRNPDVVLWRTLLRACGIHGEVDMAERIMSQVLELAPVDEGIHVLLSNLYASTRKWSQVIELKTKMRQVRFKKSPALSWVEVDREVHTFMAGDLSHPNSGEIVETLEELIQKVKVMGYVPDKRFVFQDMDDEKKEKSLYYHSEKLAISFVLWKTSNKTSSIRILKNLRVCGDCHAWIKFVSKAVQREIIARDAKRFHHFKDGLCSCADYW